MQVLNKGSFCLCAGVLLIGCRASVYSLSTVLTETLWGNVLHLVGLSWFLINCFNF